MSAQRVTLAGRIWASAVGSHQLPSDFRSRQTRPAQATICKTGFHFSKVLEKDLIEFHRRKPLMFLTRVYDMTELSK